MSPTDNGECCAPITAYLLTPYQTADAYTLTPCPNGYYFKHNLTNQPLPLSALGYSAPTAASAINQARRMYGRLIRL